MIKHLKKRTLSLCLSLTLVFGLIPAPGIHAANVPCAEYTGSNVEAQNYDRWAVPVYSYLTSPSEGTLMRVQAGGNIEGVMAEYFDSSYNLTASKPIPQELPVFGGFYASESHYFLVTGQNNPEESSTLPVFRITKYDKNWNRLGQAELTDCNTTVPFDAGSVRMDTCGKYLLIHTCHEMYRTSDGLNHQANVTIELDMDTMTITDSYTRIMNNDYGYVSHSFNQFIKIENNRIVSVNHGDAIPRSIVLLKYQTDASTGRFTPGYSNPCTAIDVMTFPEDSIGNYNITGAAVGGFELSSSSYLVAGHSAPQDKSPQSSRTRNIFVAAVNKTTSAVTTNWLTSYAEGDGTTSTPQMVKLSDSEFLVLWSRDNTVYYTKVNDAGERISDIYSHEGNLSDCVPIAANDKVIWYTWKNSNVTFYEISLSDLSTCTVTKKNTGHDYVNQGVTGGYASLVCEKCREVTQMPVITSFLTFWNTSSTGTFSTQYTQKQDVGNVLYYWNPESYMESSSGADNFNTELEITSSDPSVVSISESSASRGTLTMKKDGTATITIRPKYNPALTKSFSFQAGNVVSEKPTDSELPVIPIDPVKPVDPENPVDPEKPDEPELPPIPIDPADPDKPSDTDKKDPSPLPDHKPSGTDKTNAGIIPASAKGSTRYIRGAYYTITKTGDSKTAEVAFRNLKNKKQKSCNVPDTVMIDGVTCKVTSIAPKAFYKMTRLTKVTIGKNVKMIGKSSFFNCKNLKTITIESSALKSIGKSALKGINSKASIKVPVRRLKAYRKLFKSATGFKKTMKIKK